MMGSGGPPPRDIIAVLAVLFVTYSMRFFSTTEALPELLSLTAAVLTGFVWQLVTYVFVGTKTSALWFLLELLILYWFSKDVFRRLGRRRFWQLVMWTAIGAAVVAVMAEAVMLAAEVPHVAFVTMQGQRMLLTIAIAAFATLYGTMQGQRMLLTIAIAAFATLYGDATIMLFFVLPIRARWFLWLEILFAFVFGLLPLKDVPGFLGVCVAVFLTYSTLTPGGPRRVVHNWRKRLEAKIIEQRLKRMRRKRQFDVIDGGRGYGGNGRGKGGNGRDRDDWIN
jgi:hypothetical protein